MIRMLAQGLGKPRSLAILGLTLIVGTAALAPACKKMPLLAPSGTAITLVASSNSLALDGVTYITAVLVEGSLSGGTTATTVVGGGAPVHDGTLVTFTASLGRLEPAEAKTTNGRVTVKLMGDGRSGTATISAFSGSATESIEVPVGAAAAARLALTANPQALSFTGGSTTISARVEDQQGNALGGIPVSFSTSRGTLSDTVARSNPQGIATTTLATTQEATVTASAGGSTASLTSTVTVTIKPRTTIQVSAPASATVGIPAAITVTPSTTTVITNVQVDFGDGSSTDLGAITGPSTLSHPFRSQGVTTVTARAIDSDGGTATSSTQVSVAPFQVALTASPSSATQPNTGSPVTFTATTTPTGVIADRYDWAFGDGTTASTLSNQVAKAYRDVGTQVATVTVIPLGAGTPASGTVTVTVKPRVTIQISGPASATVGAPAAITVTPTGSAALANVSIDFGDGTSADLGAIASTTTVSHAFRNQGVATVTARAVDSEGGTAVASTQVVVAPFQVTVSSSPNSTTQPTPDTPVTFTAVITPSSVIADRFDWTFGDGTQASTSSNQVAKVYAAPATYIVTVRVTPLGGGTSSSHQITVTVKAASLLP